MLNNLIIGSSSQLAHYMPKDYLRISSRNIDFNYFRNESFDRVYLTFAEQRTYDNSLSEKDFIDINTKYTLRIIDFFASRANLIITYGTCELFNKHTGAINIHHQYNYNYSPYIKSKEILCNSILDYRELNIYNNIIIIHPFNFNSMQRKANFLFNKILTALIYSKKININNINFKRDLTHASYIADQSIIATQDCLIGAGELVNIEDFVCDLFKYYNKNYLDYLVINRNKSLDHNYWCETENLYDTLLTDFIIDIGVL